MAGSSRFLDHAGQFDEIRFIELVEELILQRVREIMTDITKLQASIDAQGALVTAAQSKINAQGARIADLEAQVAAAGSVDQPTIDALQAKVDADNATLTSITVP